MSNHSGLLFLWGLSWSPELKLLAGIRVLDLSRILAGPWATQCLADFGAEVWKIERPGVGDDTRQWGPPWLGDTGLSAYFLSCNRGKQSIAIDFSTAEGAQLVRELASRADLLVENFRPGALAAYGLDQPTLAALNPRLIYCSISGFGQTGPWAQRPGYDALIQALGGLMSITGVPDGEPGAGPLKVGVAVTDLMTGMYALSAMLAALHRREQTGEGCHLDVSLLHTQVAALANQSLNFLVSGVVPQRLGSAHPNIVPYQSFATSDGHLLLAVGNDQQFQRFCMAAELGILQEDSRFQSNQSRLAHRDTLIALIAQRLAQCTTQYWTALLAAYQVPAGPVNSIAQVFAMPQLQSLGVQLQLEHPELGVVPQVSNPVHLHGTSLSSTMAPPLLGQDTDARLVAELNLSPERLMQLRRDGVIA